MGERENAAPHADVAGAQCGQPPVLVREPLDQVAHRPAGPRGQAGAGDAQSQRQIPAQPGHLRDILGRRGPRCLVGDRSQQSRRLLGRQRGQGPAAALPPDRSAPFGRSPAPARPPAPGSSGRTCASPAALSSTSRQRRFCSTARTCAHRLVRGGDGSCRYVQRPQQAYGDVAGGGRGGSTPRRSTVEAATGVVARRASVARSAKVVLPTPACPWTRTDRGRAAVVAVGGGPADCRQFVRPAREVGDHSRRFTQSWTGPGAAAAQRADVLLQPPPLLITFTFSAAASAASVRGCGVRLCPLFHVADGPGAHPRRLSQFLHRQSGCPPQLTKPWSQFHDFLHPAGRAKFLQRGNGVRCGAELAGHRAPRSRTRHGSSRAVQEQGGHRAS